MRFKPRFSAVLREAAVVLRKVAKGVRLIAVSIRFLRGLRGCFFFGFLRFCAVVEPLREPHKREGGIGDVHPSKPTPAN